MSASVKVSNLENNAVWEKQISIEEYKQIKKSTFKGHNTIDPPVALLYPVRTNNANNLAVDLLLPTTFNIVPLVHNYFLKAIATIVAVVIDIVTLPIRLVTCFSRIQSNTKRDIAPLHRYLLDQNVDSKLFETGYVHVQLTRIRDGHPRVRSDREKNVNLIEMPDYKERTLISGGKGVA